jgi:hypothetical protein
MVDWKNDGGIWWDVSNSASLSDEDTATPDPREVLFEAGLVIVIPLILAALLELAARLSAG